MTLPKKSSRGIEVDGRLYRWMVRKAGLDSVRLTVEDQETGEMRQRFFHEGWEGDPPAVRPGKVRDFILSEFIQDGLTEELE